MKARLAVAALSLTLALAGCSGGGSPGGPIGQATDNPSGTPTASSDLKRTTGPGKYTFTAHGGGTGTLQVPAPAPPEIEELRVSVNAPPVTYITAAVDNRNGTELINMHTISIFTPEGKELKYQGAWAYVNELRGRLPEKAPSDVYNKFSEVHNAHIDEASPLEVKDFLMVGPEVPPLITGITVYATGGFNPVQAKFAGR